MSMLRFIVIGIVHLGKKLAFKVEFTWNVLRSARVRPAFRLHSLSI